MVARITFHKTFAVGCSIPDMENRISELEAVHAFSQLLAFYRSHRFLVCPRSHLIETSLRRLILTRIDQTLLTNLKTMKI
jgi:hypothetical protein